MKQTPKLPSVTFVACTFNSQTTLKECLDSVKHLDYPKHLIDVVIIDGGSTDETLNIAKTYTFVKVHIVPGYGPEAATAVGYQKAKGDLIVNFPSDNVIPAKNWLKRMVRPFEFEQDLVGVETLHYHYEKNDKPLNKYFALFGVNDPVAFYLNKRDRATQFETSWHLSSKAIDKGDYFLTTFTPENMPTLGANGFIIRKKFAKQISKDPHRFFHIDSCLDLVKEGNNTFAFVKNSVWHKTGEEFVNFMKKRKKYATQLYFKQQATRRYHLYNPKTDKVKLLLFMIFSLTFIEPLIQSMRGYMKIRDRAWFLHPFVCFCLTMIYTYTVITFRLNYEKKI
jgi:glycosyltransferase involved in cell wall biosynthesis